MTLAPAGSLLKILVLFSVGVGASDAYLYFRGIEARDGAEIAWPLIFAVLLATWVEADSRSHANIYRPYELGFFSLVFWFAYVPYYLIRTRRAFAILWMLGFSFLYMLGYLLKSLLYLSS